MYVDNWTTAKKLLFQGSLVSNVKSSLYDLFIVNCLTKYTYKQIVIKDLETNEHVEFCNRTDELK